MIEGVRFNPSAVVAGTQHLGNTGEFQVRHTGVAPNLAELGFVRARPLTVNPGNPDRICRRQDAH
jgi:hypothetical protein